ncbi:hypothetical protein HED60_10605 [Planctomycetales bacterium ZRK34]|nr:hypothetical protein HED60_10605 [Planctomycetales bacterium ZRK34]
MTPGNDQHETLRDLMQAMLDGEFDDAQRQQLEARILEDETARQHYLDVMEIHAMVQWSQQWNDAEGDEAPPVKAPVRATRPARPWRRWAMAAALVLAGIATMMIIESNRAGTGDEPGQTTDKTSSLAMITDMHNVRWADGSQPLQAGQPLVTRRLELESGRVQMMFASGAVVDLIGPAVFEMSDRNRAWLHRGELLAWVPDKARGFTVDTPAGRVVDLGTEFALRVDDKGMSLLHVLSGHVEVQGVRTESLIAGQSVQFDATSLSSPTQGSTTPFAELLRPMPMLGYVHYGFDQLDDAKTPDDGVGMLGGPFNANLTWAQPGEGGAAPTQGPFDKALRFDGINDYLTTDFPGIGDDAPRTVALWVRIPADVSRDNAYGMLSYGQHAPGRTWQMSWNPIPADGAVGAARVGLHSSQLVGTTDLRDGQWHHIAATFDGSRFKLYVDAQLEADDDFANMMHTDVSPASHPLTLGRNLSPGGGFFRGAIDEVYFFDAALTADDVRHLMQTNHVPGYEGE